MTADELFQFLTLMTSATMAYYAMHVARRLFRATARPVVTPQKLSMADYIDRLERETFVGDYADGDPLGELRRHG